MRSNPIVRAFVREWLPWIGIAAGTAWILGFAWWMFLDAPPSGSVDFVIPEGTRAAIDAGRPTFVPDNITLASGGTLRVVNNDSAAHLIAGSVVPPGSIAYVTTDVRSGQLLCSVHPGGLDYDTATRGNFFLTTFTAAFALGIPAGLLCALVAMVTKRLDGGSPQPA
jgi:hypothetical protein